MATASWRSAAGGVAVFLSVMSLGVSALAQAPDAAPAGHKFDWYHWADVRAVPYMFGMAALADGNPSNTTGFADGPEIGGTLEFNFPKPVTVTALRLVQRGLLATGFELRADTAGKRTYDTVVTVRKDDKAIGGQWIAFPVNREVTGLRLAAVSGSPGYRKPYPIYSEIEIYTKASIAGPARPVEKAGCELTAGKVAPMPIMLIRNIKWTPCIDIWHTGLLANGSNLPENVETFPGYQQLINQLRDIDADGVRFFLESTAWGPKPWKTAYPPGSEKEPLKALIDALHKRGYITSIFLHAWMPPIQRAGKQAKDQYRRWDYPYEQSDLVLSKGLGDIYTERYPCIISEDDFKQKWTGIMREVVERGIDGVYLMPDEYYFKGHNLFTVNCPACQRDFKARYGYDSLPKPDTNVTPNSLTTFGPDPRTPMDTEQYRKWKLFEYERIGELFDGVAGELKKVNTNLALICSANPASPYFSNMAMEHGIAFDIIGRGTNINAVQLYASVPMDVGEYTALARRMRAAFPNAVLDASIQGLAIYETPADFTIKFIGYLLPQIMNGATRAHAYRLNYLQYDNWWVKVQKGIRMMRLLEQWDLANSATPADTCLLLSRASEDWWQVKAHSLLGKTPGDSKRNFLMYSDENAGGAPTSTEDATERSLNYERVRGMMSTKCMESLLIENGIQYDARWIERAETMTDLKKYKLLVLPFGYAMSQAAFDRIREAVEAGSKLLIYDQLAPVNEYGVAYPQPLLKSLLGRTNVVYEKTSLGNEGMSLPVRQANRKLLYTLLDNGYYFSANDAKVEYLVRKTAKGLLLYLANWERERTAAPVIGVPLPAGLYATTICSSLQEDLSEGLFGGKLEASEQDLAKFGVTLAPGEVKLVRIVPAPVKPKAP